MFYILATLVCGISFAPVILLQTDIWHAQGFWVQAILLVAFCYSFFESPNYKPPKDIPIGLITLWCGLSTGFICYLTLIQNKYNTISFFPYFNFVCLLVFYRLLVQYIDSKKLLTILKVLRQIFIWTLILCVFQYLGIAQLFRMYQPDNPSVNNPVIGMVGNGTHLSGFLAMMAPLLFLERLREGILSFILLFILLFLTGTATNDPSLSGFAALFVIIMFFVFKINKRAFFFIGLLACVLGVIVYINFGSERFFSTNGRVAMWSYYFDYFKRSLPLTGNGLGAINGMYLKTPHPGWRHLHLEYFQFLLEIGIIGIVLIVNLLYRFILDKAVTYNQSILKACVIGFFVTCIFNYSAHLWIFTTTAMFYYAGLQILKRDENAGFIN